MPDYNAIQKINQQAAQKSTTEVNPYPNLTTSEISSGGRYPIYHFALDNEDIYGRSQTTGDKWANAVGKFAATTATTFLSGTAGLANGVYRWMEDGKFSSFYDNEFNRGLDGITADLENKLPTYYTNAENSAAWYSPKTWGTANFWSDTIFKNAGFAAGAILSGGVWGKAISPLVSTIAKGVSAGAAAEISAISEGAAAAGKSISQVNLEIAQTLKTLGTTQKAINFGARVTQAGLSTFGEASIEALHANQEYKNKLITDYQDKYGVAPEGEQLKEIEALSDDIGNITFGSNMALLTATNYIQFPKLMGTFWKGTKAEVAAAERGIGSVVREADGALSLPTVGRAGRWMNRFRNYGILSASESFEEGAQYAVPIAAQDWVEKGKNGEQDFVSSLGKGIKETLNSKQGMLSILAGGITGGIIERVGGVIQNRSLLTNSARERLAVRNNTQTFIDAANTASFTNSLKAGTESLKRGEVLNKELAQYAQDNNRLGYEDARLDQTLNYLLPRIQYGRVDLVQEDLKGYRELAASPEGWQELMTSGIVNEEMEQQDFIDNLNNIERLALKSQEQFEALNLRYGNIRNEDQTPKYTPQVLLKMAYTSSKIDDYTERISTLLPDVNAAGLDIMTFANSIATGEFTEEDLDTLDQQINSRIGLTPETKTTLKETIADILELSARKQLNIEAYQQLRDNPEIYNDPIRNAVDPDLDQIDQLATPENIDTETDSLLRELARRISEGEKITDAEDLELQANNAELLETYLEALRPDLDRIKEQFLVANDGREFQMTINGTPQTGTLSQQQGNLYFNYGDLQTEISNQDFINGTIQGEYSDPQGYLNQVDPRTGGLPQGRLLALARDLAAQAQDRRNEIAESIEQKTQEILRIEQEVRNEGTVRYFTRDMVSDMTTLLELKQESQDEITALEVEDQDLQNVITQYQELLPTTAQHQVDLLQDQIENLQRLNIGNGLIQNALTGLINSSSDLLSRLGKKVMSRVYSWKRNLATQPYFQTMVRATEQYELNPNDVNLQAVLQVISQNTEAITNLDSKPLTEGERNWILDKLQSIQDQAARVEPLLRAKQQVLEDIKSVQEDIDQREELFQDNEPVTEEPIAEAPKGILERGDINERILDVVATEDNYNSWSNIRDKSDYEQFINLINSTINSLLAVPIDRINRESITAYLENNKAFKGKDILKKVLDIIVPEPVVQITPREEELAYLRAEAIIENEGLTGQARYDRMRELQDEWLASQTPPPPAPEPTVQESFEEDGDKIPASRLFNATYLPPTNFRDQGWYLRLNNFINTLGVMPQERRNNLRAVTVTQATEAIQGLNGLIAKYNTDSKGNPYLGTDFTDAPITLVIQEVKEDGSMVYLDQAGQELSPSDPDFLDKLLITKVRAAKLTWSDGQPNYSRATPEEAEQYLRDFKVDRQQMLTSPIPREFSFSTSLGRDASRNKVPISGNLVSPELIRTKKILKVVSRKGQTTNNVTVTDPQGNSISIKPGSILLEAPDAFQQVYPRPLSDKDYNTIKNTLLQIAKNVKTGTDISTLVNYLYGTANIAFGDNYSTVKVGPTKSTLSTEKVSNPSYETALRTNITNTNINRELLEKNQPFSEVIGFEDNGQPLLKVWPTYQEYLLSTDNGRQPLVDAYNKTDKYLILSKPTGSISRVNERSVKQRTPKPTKADLLPGDSISYTNQKLKTPAGKELTLSGDFTVLVTKSSGLDIFRDPQGNQIQIPQGVNVIRMNGTNDIFYISTASHNRTENKKSYKPSSTEGQEIEVEDILPSSDPVMEQEAMIPQEIVALVNESESVKTGTVVELPKVEAPRNPTTSGETRVPKSLLEAPTLEVGDTTTINNPNGSSEVWEVTGTKGDKFLLRRTLIRPGQEPVIEEDKLSNFTSKEFGPLMRSIIGKAFFQSKQTTLPQITPNCD